MRKVFMTAGVALLLAAPLTAQSKPDFSGSWIVVADQGGTPVRAAAAGRAAGAAGRNAGALAGDPAAVADARAAVQAARASGATAAEARQAAVAALGQAGVDTAAVRATVRERVTTAAAANRGGGRAAAVDPADRAAVREARQSGDTAAVRAARVAAGAGAARAANGGAGAAAGRGAAGGRAAADAGLQAFAGLGLRATLAQSATTLTITRSTQLGEIETVVNLDGTPSSQTLDRGGSKITQLSTGTWDGDELVINTTIASDGRSILTSMTLSIVADQLVVERMGDGGQPGGTQRFVKAPR